MQRLSTLSILVPTYEAGLAFFVGQLGFELLEDTDQGHKRWVKVAPKGAETAFLIAKATTPEQIAAIGNQGGGRIGRGPDKRSPHQIDIHHIGNRRTKVQLGRCTRCHPNDARVFRGHPIP